MGLPLSPIADIAGSENIVFEECWLSVDFLFPVRGRYCDGCSFWSNWLNIWNDYHDRIKFTIKYEKDALL